MEIDYEERQYYEGELMFYLCDNNDDPERQARQIIDNILFDWYPKADIALAIKELLEPNKHQE